MGVFYITYLGIGKEEKDLWFKMFEPSTHAGIWKCELDLHFSKIWSFFCNHIPKQLVFQALRSHKKIQQCHLNTDL